MDYSKDCYCTNTCDNDINAIYCQCQTKRRNKMDENNEFCLKLTEDQLILITNALKLKPDDKDLWLLGYIEGCWMAYLLKNRKDKR